MPGILGFITRSGSVDGNTRQLVTMLDTMVQEPFQVYGTYTRPEHGLYLGWVSHPEAFVNWNPVISASGDEILIFSGEHLDPTSTDTGDNGSKLLRLYQQRGERFFGDLNGWFAGVVINLGERSVRLFNDRYGLHRIHVHQDDDSFVFASEAKAILSVRPQTRRLDVQALGEFLAVGTALDDRTIFSGISLMPGGSLWTFRDGRPVPQKGRYFDPAAWEQQPALPDEQFYGQLRDTMSGLLPRYFLPAEHLGVSLTGGLDTRMMMAGRAPATRLAACYTYSGVYRDCFDVQVARDIAAACGERHHTLRFGEDFFRNFAAYAADTIWVTDGCLDITGAHELYFSRQARQLARIRMTGNYGSEVLRSVSTFKYLPPSESLFDAEVGVSVRQAAVPFARLRSAHPVTFAAFKQVPWQLFGRLAAAQSQMIVRSPYMDNALVGLLYQAAPRLRQTRDCSVRLIADLDPALAAIRTDMGDGGGGSAVSGFVRKAYRYALFKGEWYYGGGMPQWLTRFDHNPVARRLEAAVVGTHKIEHYRLWFRDQLHDYVSEVLGDRDTLTRPYFNRRQVEQLLTAHRSRVGNHQNAISKIISLELIQRSLISGASPRVRHGGTIDAGGLTSSRAQGMPGVAIGP